MQDNQSESERKLQKMLDRAAAEAANHFASYADSNIYQSDQGGGSKFKEERKQPSTARAGIKYEKSNVQRLGNY